MKKLLVTKTFNMKSIRSYFKLTLISKDISDLNLLYFTEDHIERLSVENTDGELSDMLEETRMLYHYFLESYKQKQWFRTAKVGQNQEVQYLMGKMKNAVRNLESYLRFKWGKDSDLYQNTFPGGLSEYCRLGKSNAKRLMNRILFSIKETNMSIEDGVKNEVIRLYAKFMHARNKQLDQQGSYKKNVNSKRQLRKDLAMRLQHNVYILAMLYSGETEKADCFFNQKLLRLKRIEKTDFYQKHKFQKIKMD